MTSIWWISWSASTAGSPSQQLSMPGSLIMPGILLLTIWTVYQIRENLSATVWEQTFWALLNQIITKIFNIFRSIRSVNVLKFSFHFSSFFCWFKGKSKKYGICSIALVLNAREKAVLGIRDILVRIGIRIRWSVPLTYGSGSDSFLQWLFLIFSYNLPSGTLSSVLKM